MRNGGTSVNTAQKERAGAQGSRAVVRLDRVVPTLRRASFNQWAAALEAS